MQFSSPILQRRGWIGASGAEDVVAPGQPGDGQKRSPWPARRGSGPGRHSGRNPEATAARPRYARGVGEDGLQDTRQIKEAGGTVFVQDEAKCRVRDAPSCGRSSAGRRRPSPRGAGGRGGESGGYTGAPVVLRLAGPYTTQSHRSLAPAAYYCSRSGGFVRACLPDLPPVLSKASQRSRRLDTENDSCALAGISVCSYRVSIFLSGVSRW